MFECLNREDFFSVTNWCVHNAGGTKTAEGQRKVPPKQHAACTHRLRAALVGFVRVQRRSSVQRSYYLWFSCSQHPRLRRGEFVVDDIRRVLFRETFFIGAVKGMMTGWWSSHLQQVRVYNSSPLCKFHGRLYTWGS